MADASLDDFFAKKDKSKKKSKASKLTPDDIIAKTDEPKKKKKSKKDKDKSQISSTTDNDTDNKGLTVNPTEEEEWKEVEEEKEKDYSGLRIANLQVTEKEDEEVEETEEREEGDEEDGEGRPRDKQEEQGPWKTGSSGTHTETVKPVEVVKEEPVKEESKSTGKYVPPSQRGGAMAAQSPAAGPTIPAHLRRKKNAPNLRSEEDFPTLGGAIPVSDIDPRTFEQVQHGGRQMDDPSKVTQQLSLGNKFSALQD